MTTRPLNQGTHGAADLFGYVSKLRSSKRTGTSVAHVEHIPAKQAQFGEMPTYLPHWMREALVARNMERPWKHQAQAWEAIESGEDVVVVTPTASGKTLCYNVPIVSMLGDSADGCALYMYPTKALSQDQCAEMNELLRASGVDEEAQVYDGDTPHEIRGRVRQRVRAVMTNPDMLHASILPNHEKWRRLFATLRFVVIDEMHTYRGVFGSHVANVIRRLQRVCRHYGADPIFVFTSATIANPVELATRLSGRTPQLVDESGAPAGEKLFMLYNPPMLDIEQGRRQSPGGAAHRLIGPLLEAGHAGIVFTRSRQGVEILTRRLKEGFEDRRKHHLADRITGYRGGYLPEARRSIERGLRSGRIQGVISTNALELGIDIGSLDVCLIAGYPGSIASTWQQAGRAGRRQTTSLSVLIAGDDPVDQYLVHNPDFFFGASPEHARIDPDNLRILAEHLKCALFELPFNSDEGFGTFDVEDTQEVLDWIAEGAPYIHFDGNRWRWSGEGYPATQVNIRAILDENFVIVDTSAQRPSVLGEIDFEGAHTTVYEKAIYQHAARLYEVYRLDYEERKAYVRSVEPEYFTQAIDQRKVFVLDVFDEDESTARPITRGHGEVRATTRFVGYKKIRFKTFENIGYGEIELPDLEKHTSAYWATVEPAFMDACGLSTEEREAAMHGLSRLLHTVAAVHLMCAPSDLLVTVQAREDEAGTPIAGPHEAIREHASSGALPVPLGNRALLEAPSVFLYDRYPGGVGFSERLFELHDELLQHAWDLVRECECSAGCPKCVGPEDLTGPHAKSATMSILRKALGQPAP